MTAINPVPAGTVKVQFGRSQQACTHTFFFFFSFFLIKTLWSQINFFHAVFIVSPVLGGRELLWARQSLGFRAGTKGAPSTVTLQTARPGSAGCAELDHAQDHSNDPAPSSISSAKIIPSL